MLKPGGQLCFVAFIKLYSDEAFDKLDEGKWCIYENRKAVSPFYKVEDPIKEYKNVVSSVGFVDCHYFTYVHKPRQPEKNLDGKYFGWCSHECHSLGLAFTTKKTNFP